MRNIALVPEGDVFQRYNRISTHHAREAGQSFPSNRIPLVRHSARTFLTFGERLLGFENFRALQMPKLYRPTFDARTDEGERVHEFGVKIALHDLCSNGRGLKTELFADKFLNGRREMRACSNGTGEFADGHDFAGTLEA